MDTGTLWSSLLDGDASMACGNSPEGAMHYRDSMDTDLSAINAFLNDYSPVEALNGLDDMLELMAGKGESCMSSLSPVSSQNSDDSNNDSDRVDEHMLQPRRSRKRAKTQHPTRKLQVSTLRAEAESLHAKLQSLQYKSARAESADAVSSRAQHAWRRVALSQLDQRRRAEDENISLREMAAVQVLEAKNLRRILRRRTRIEMMEDMLGVKERVRLLKQTPLNDPGIFQQLTQDASALYDRIDSLFAINNMDALPFTGHTREAYLDKVNGTYYEVRQKRLVPFSVQDTEKAVWQCLGSLGLTNRRDGVPATLNTTTQQCLSSTLTTLLQR